MKDREKHPCRALVADQQPTERAKPGDRPFDDPAVAIRAQPATVFITALTSVLAVRTGERDATSGEMLPQGVAVVSAVPEQVLRIPPMGRYARGERRIDKGDFGRRRRGDGDSQRKTLTLDQYHAL